MGHTTVQLLLLLILLLSSVPLSLTAKETKGKEFQMKTKK